ncbi:TPA: hypothetical protein ACS5XR_005205 [Salmonella enterica]
MPNHDRFECQTLIDLDAILHSGPPATPARLLLAATRCQCAASGLSRDGRFSIQCSSLRFAGGRPSSRFRGINSPTMRQSVSYSTVGVDPLPDATNRQRAAGNGITVMPPAGC